MFKSILNWVKCGKWRAVCELICFEVTVAWHLPFFVQTVCINTQLTFRLSVMSPVRSMITPWIWKCRFMLYSTYTLVYSILKITLFYFFVIFNCLFSSWLSILYKKWRCLEIFLHVLYCFVDCHWISCIFI